MLKFRLRWYLIVLLVLGLGLAGFAGRLAYNWYFPENMADVVSVIDGDTLILDNGKVVRLIGIDSPEKDEKFYYEAKDKLSSLVLHKTVRLEKDKENKDQYGRLLRYVYVSTLPWEWTGMKWEQPSGSGKFVNDTMISSGYAASYPYPPNTKYVELFDGSERFAREVSIGIWAEEKESSAYVPKVNTTSPFETSQPKPTQSFRDILGVK